MTLMVYLVSTFIFIIDDWVESHVAALFFFLFYEFVFCFGFLFVCLFAYDSFFKSIGNTSVFDVAACDILSFFFACISAWTTSMVRMSFLLALGTTRESETKWNRRKVLVRARTMGLEMFLNSNWKWFSFGVTHQNRSSYSIPFFWPPPVRHLVQLNERIYLYNLS